MSKESHMMSLKLIKGKLKTVLFCSVLFVFAFYAPAIGNEQNLSGAIYFFNSKSGIVRFDAMTRTMKPLGIKGNHLAISPDGTRLAYTDNRNVLSIYDLSSGLNNVFEKDRHSVEGIPAFISNSEIAHVRDIKSVSGIYVTPVNRMEWRLLPYSLPKRFLHDTLAAVPGTQSFVAGGRNSLYLITSEGTKQIFAGAANFIRYPAVSSDGKKVAFVYDTGTKSIWVVGIDGSNSENLINASATSIAWSPDGRYIAYSDTGGAVRGNEYKTPYSDKTHRGFGAFAHRIWIMRSDGSDAHPLLTADGKELYLMYNLVWASR